MNELYFTATGKKNSTVKQLIEVANTDAYTVYFSGKPMMMKKAVSILSTLKTRIDYIPRRNGEFALRIYDPKAMMEKLISVIGK